MEVIGFILAAGIIGFLLDISSKLGRIAIKLEVLADGHQDHEQRLRSAKL